MGFEVLQAEAQPAFEVVDDLERHERAEEVLAAVLEVLVAVLHLDPSSRGDRRVLHESLEQPTVAAVREASLQGRGGRPGGRGLGQDPGGRGGRQDGEEGDGDQTVIGHAWASRSDSASTPLWPRPTTPVLVTSSFPPPSAATLT